MSFIRRRSGSSWVHIEEFRRRSGSSWVITNNVRRRSGSSWINVMQGINMTNIGTRTAKLTFYGYNLASGTGSITPTSIFGDTISRIEWNNGTDREILFIDIQNSSLGETYLSGCSFQGFGYAARSSFSLIQGVTASYGFDFGSALPTSGSARIYFYGGA